MGRKAIDLTGRRFGRLVVLGPSGEPRVGKRHSLTWLCQCDCGEQCIVDSGSLCRGSTKSCGCLRKEHARSIGGNNVKDLTGQRFGKLVVIERAGTSRYGQAIWRCKCDCGKEDDVLSSNLIRGHVKSCGCSRKRKKKGPDNGQ